MRTQNINEHMFCAGWCHFSSSVVVIPIDGQHDVANHDNDNSKNGCFIK